MACSAEQVRQFELRRRERMPLWRIARDAGRSLATVARHVARLGLSRLASLQPVEPIRRYERERPGELLHIDTKRRSAAAIVLWNSDRTWTVRFSRPSRVVVVLGACVLDGVLQALGEPPRISRRPQLKRMEP